MSSEVKGGLFVVRRPFKAHGILHNVGEVIEDPTSIKLFRSRLNDRDIIELLPGNTVTNLTWLEYLESRATEAIDSRIYSYAGEQPSVELTDPPQPATVSPKTSIVPDEKPKTSAKKATVITPLITPKTK